MEEKIYRYNSQNIKLKGIYNKCSNDCCVLHITGWAGCFDKFAKQLLKTCEDRNLSYLCGYSQSSGIIEKLKQKSSNDEKIDVFRGAAYEDFDNTIPDIDVWVQFLKEEGFKNIYFVAHSYGCNKVMHYLNEVKESNIKSCVLLAPQDLTDVVNYDCHKGMKEEAQNYLENGEPNKILSKLFLEFCEISAKTYLDFYTRKDIHNIPFLNEINGDFSRVENINLPCYIIIGNKDHIFDPPYNKATPLKVLANLVKHFKNCEYTLIDGCGHNFKNNEELAAGLVNDFLLTLN